ncbi:MAG TPA: oligosaccharide flippase family protein [Acetobacteraceae bacterium]|nr:oligosaccharide flippase family protein [Acetobacteraceae bacterium]
MSDPSGKSLLEQTAHGAGWMIAWRFATRVLGLVSTLTLVRLLLPADFGLVALASSLSQAFGAFAALGVEEQVIREKDPGRAIYDTAFTLNVLRGLLTAALVAMAAYPAAAFFREPRLATVMFATGFGLCLSAFENIGIVDFRREFAFHKEFRLFILPRILGIALAIATAFVFRSYWALVVGILASRISRLVLSYGMHPYRPRLTLSAWRGMVAFSTWVWLTSIVGLLRGQVDSFSIGRMLGAAQFGIYSVGGEVAALPTTELVEPMCRATFSAFAAARNSGTAVLSTYRRVIGATAILTFPAGFGISLVADPVVRLALGPKWLDAIPVIEVFGIGLLASSFGSIAGTMLAAHGRMGTSFRIGLVALLLRAAFVPILALHFGLVGAAAGATISIAGEQALFVASMSRGFGLRASHLLADVWRPLLGVGVMACVLVGSGLGWSGGPGTMLHIAGRLALGSTVGAATFGAVVLLAWVATGRPDGAERDLLELGRRIRRRLVRLVWRRSAATAEQT